MSRDKVYELASEIDDFLSELERKFGRIAQFERDNNATVLFPEDDFGLAEAILDWRENGKNPNSIFTAPDPYLILYRQELTQEYGLKVMTYEEAEEYKAKLSGQVGYGNMITTGDPLASPEYNANPKKRDEALKIIEQWATVLKNRYPGVLN